MKKRLLSLALALVMALTLLPIVSVAVDDTPHTHNDQTFTPWTDKNYLPVVAGCYYLTADVTLDSMWTPTADIHLCLNGHTITGPSSQNAINLPKANTVELNIYDCGDGKGVITTADGVGTPVYVYDGSTLRLYSGKVTGGNTGVIVDQGATFQMYGGTVTGNKIGVIVRYDTATFQVQGDAVITGNSSGNNVRLYQATMQLSGRLGTKASIGLSPYEWTDVDSAEGGRLLVAQGAGGYTVTIYDLVKLSSDNDKYQLTLDGGKVYLEPKPAEILTISTVDDLKAFRDSVNAGNTYQGKTVTLTADLDLQGSEEDPWTPIGIPGNADAGIPAKQFWGTFEGGGHTISGVYINTTEDEQGLFKSLNNGAIKNLGVAGSITGGNGTGGVVGYNGGTVTGCHNAAKVSGTRDVGGVVGCGGAINCYNIGAVSGEDYVGGIVGGNYTLETVWHCYNTGTVSATGTHVGGVVGYMSTGYGYANNYYLDASCNQDGSPTGSQKVTARQLVSGEVAWRLQDGGTKPQSQQFWGQSLSGDKGERPQLTADPAKQVYKVTFMADGEEYAAAYANQNGTVALPAKDPAKAGLEFAQWADAETGGTQFTASTPIAGDTTVYAQFAPPKPHVHAVSVDCETTGEGLVTFTAWDKTDSLPEGSGNYYLTTDVDLANSWRISAGEAVNLCLNGHTVTSADSIATLSIDENAPLNLCDCQGSGSVSNSGGGTVIVLPSFGTLHLYGGAVTGGWRGVTVAQGATFHMHGGSVENVTDSTGIGVHLDGGIFFLDGGTVSRNTKGVVVNNAVSVFWAEGNARITGNTTANVELESDCYMKLSKPLGEHASIGLSAGWWHNVDEAENGLLAVQGADGYTVTADDFKKLSSDNVKYQLVQDADGKVYFAPQPDGTVTGTLTGTARSLSWACSPEGTLAVAPLLGQDEAVLAATYDKDGALVGVKKLTADQLTAQVDRDAAKLKLFWLDGHAAPLSPAETAWEKQ